MKITIETIESGPNLDKALKSWGKVCNHRVLADGGNVEIEEPRSHDHNYKVRFTLEYERVE